MDEYIDRDGGISMRGGDRYGLGVAGAAALSLVIVGVGLLVYIAIALWAYMFWIALTILLVGVGGAILELYMRWERHKVDLVARRNRAVLIHESERGFGYVKEGQVIGYSHSFPPTNLLPPPTFRPDELVPEPPAAPGTFSELVQGGYIAPGLDYVLGFGEGNEPIRMPLLTSLGIGGFPGAGKTVTTLLLMLETIIKYSGRVRFLVVDPHKYVAGDQSLSSKVGELAPFFLTLQDVRTTVPPDDQEYHALLSWADNYGLSSVVEGGEEMKGWLAILELEMDRRVHGKEGDMWVVVFDEFASVMDGPESKRVAAVLKKMNREARKLLMFALLSSVDWKANNSGGTDVRNAISSFVLHGMPQAVAELIAPGEASKEAPTLEPGEMVLYNRGRSVRGHVPFANEEDARKVVEQFYPRGLVQISEVVTSGTEVAE